MPNYGKGRQGYGLLIQICNYCTSKGLLQGLESICTVRSVLTFLTVPLNTNIHAGTDKLQLITTELTYPALLKCENQMDRAPDQITKACYS